MTDQKPGIRRLVLDVLKLHEPDLTELASIIWKIIHSIDQVVAGKEVVESIETPQD
ncbi:MAG: hypothetical protein ACTSP4_17275 [Candidatus Hodarchaeales archaeon]